MQKSTTISAALVVLIFIAGAVFWGVQRGVIFVKDGTLGFSKDAITNPVPAIILEPGFPADFPAEARNIYQQNVASIAQTLETDPTNIEAWLDLAIYYRMVNNHAGAEEIWKYVRKLYPNDAISVHNLGEHYFHYAKDYVKAEKYYEESITKNPGLESNYTDLYEMYKYAYKQDTTAAIDILQRGIAAVGAQQAAHFKILLGREYRDRGDKENARKYLTEARNEAQARGDRSLASELQREIDSL
jgi:tetratricopeptide (TPR) repeat protein